MSTFHLHHTSEHKIHGITSCEMEFPFRKKHSVFLHLIIRGWGRDRDREEGIMAETFPVDILEMLLSSLPLPCIPRVFRRPISLITLPNLELVLLLKSKLRGRNGGGGMGFKRTHKVGPIYRGPTHRESFISKSASLLLFYRFRQKRRNLMNWKSRVRPLFCLSDRQVALSFQTSSDLSSRSLYLTSLFHQVL